MKCLTANADVQAPTGTPDYSVKAGKMTSQVAAALAAARTADRSQRGPAGPGAGDASVRFGQAHFATTQEGFARQFGPYAGAGLSAPKQGCKCPGPLVDIIFIGRQIYQLGGFWKQIPLLF